MLKLISGIALAVGILLLIIGAVLHAASTSLMGVTHWGFAAGSVCLFLFSIALNTFIANQEE